MIYVPKAKNNNNNDNTDSTTNTKNNLEMKDVSDRMAGTDVRVYIDDEKKGSGAVCGENGEPEMDDSMLKNADQEQEVVDERADYITGKLTR